MENRLPFGTFFCHFAIALFLFEVLQVVKCAFACVLSSRTQLILDAEQLVVFRNAVRTGRRACFDLAGIRSNRDIRDRAVLGLTGTVRDNRSAP